MSMTKPEHDLLIAMAKVVAATYVWVEYDHRPGVPRFYENLIRAIQTAQKAETD